MDRVQREVVLEDIKITKAEFPTLSNEAEVLTSAVASPFGQALRVVPLDRLTASLAAAGVTPPNGVAVKNTPPRVILSDRPAVLIPIQGTAVEPDRPRAYQEGRTGGPRTWPTQHRVRLHL